MRLLKLLIDRILCGDHEPPAKQRLCHERGKHLPRTHDSGKGTPSAALWFWADAHTSRSLPAECNRRKDGYGRLATVPRFPRTVPRSAPGQALGRGGGHRSAWPISSRLGLRLVRAGRIELPRPVWKTEVLPLNYARVRERRHGPHGARDRQASDGPRAPPGQNGFAAPAPRFHS